MSNPTPPTESVKQLHYLAAALKAPRITEAATRLAAQARDAGWTHEDYLAAVLEREVSARNASGAESRIRAAEFTSRKRSKASIGTPSPARGNRSRPWRRAHSSPRHATSCSSARPVPVRHIWRPDSTSSPHVTGSGAVRNRHRLGDQADRSPPQRTAAQRTHATAPLRAHHRRRSRLSPIRKGRGQPVLPTRLIALRTRLAHP